MTVEEQISQRDLRMRSREIMDAVEQGASFTVTRDGRAIGELIPRPAKRVFVSRQEFVALGAGLPSIDAERFREELDASTDPFADDPYKR